jgi:hypothetical protein
MGFGAGGGGGGGLSAKAVPIVKPSATLRVARIRAGFFVIFIIIVFSKCYYYLLISLRKKLFSKPHEQCSQ